MFDAHSDEIARLIEPGRVSRRVYTDPDIFELEMRRLFGRAWLYVGHESQVPNPGDFVTTELGRQPVVMIRHHDNTVRVLLNRCSHRANQICEAPRGNSRALRCQYHGWTFAADGTLFVGDRSQFRSEFLRACNKNITLACSDRLCSAAAETRAVGALRSVGPLAGDVKKRPRCLKRFSH